MMENSTHVLHNIHLGNVPSSVLFTLPGRNELLPIYPYSYPSSSNNQTYIIINNILA